MVENNRKKQSGAPVHADLDRVNIMVNACILKYLQIGVGL